MSKRAKIFLIFFNVLIIFTASWNIRSWQKDQEIKQVKAWAEKNNLHISLDRPEWAVSLPQFIYNFFPERIRAIFKPEGDLIETEQGELVVLESEKPKVLDLSAISHLRHVESLEIAAGSIKNFSVIKNFKKLKYLEVNGSIDSYEELGELQKMRELWLLNNQVADLAFVSKMTQLEELLLSSTHVKDLTPLAKNKNLKLLYLNNNKFLDLHKVKEFEKLVPTCGVTVFDEALKP